MHLFLVIKSRKKIATSLYHCFSCVTMVDDREGCQHQSQASANPHKAPA